VSLAAAGLILMVVATPVARAQTTPAPPPMNDEARAHYDRGLNLYAARDYAGAIRELEQGYAVEPRREFLFALAQAQRLAGDCQRAVPLYQRFLATTPTAAQESAAQLGLARCAQQMAATPPTVVLTPPAAPSPPVTATPAPAPESWHRDVAGGALLTAGAVGLGVGSAFIAAAITAPKSATDYDSYQNNRVTAERRWRLGLGSAVAGAALVAGGAYRYVVIRRRAAAASGVSATVTGALLPTFAGVSLEGRF
jgi:tetratricopeptide (TPR) repeat protein